MQRLSLHVHTNNVPWGFQYNVLSTPLHTSFDLLHPLQSFSDLCIYFCCPGSSHCQYHLGPQCPLPLLLLDIPTLCLHDQIRTSNGWILLCRFPAYSLPFVPSYHRTALHKPLQTLRNCDSVPFLLAVWENQPAKTSSPFTYTTPSTSSNTASTPTPVCTATKLN